MESYLNKIKNKTKGYFSFQKINPHKHWHNIIYIYSFIIVILGLFSFYLLYKVKKQEIFNVPPKPTESVVMINEKLLNKVQEYFAEKKLKELEIKNGGVLYKDPSFN